MQYNHWDWNRILILPYRIGIDHSIEMMEEKWKITAMKLEWINPIDLEWKSSWIRHSINPAVYPSIICSIVNQWVSNHGFINLIMNQIGCVWFLIVVVISNINRSSTFRHLDEMLYFSISLDQRELISNADEYEYRINQFIVLTQSHWLE